MSIKGIDAQMMITRATELTKDSSAQLRKNELMHDYLAAQTRAIETRENQSVARTLKPQEIEIHLNNDREGSGGWTGPDGEREAEEREQADQDRLAQLAPIDPHTIDITI